MVGGRPSGDRNGRTRQTRAGGHVAAARCAPFGFILANGFFLLLAVGFQFDSTHAARSTINFLSWGWRIPFLLSIVMVLLGLYVRVKLHETPVFANAVQRGETSKRCSD